MTSTHEARAPTGQDRIALWENSPELRESVKADLYEWGGAQRGGFPDLGIYKQQPYLNGVLPSPGQLRYNVEKVQAITDTMTLWRLEADHADRIARKEVLRYLRIIKRYFIGQGAVEGMAKSEDITRQHFYRLLGEAMRQFWTLHY